MRLVAIAIVAVAACSSGQNPSPTPTATPTASPPPTQTQTPTPDAGVAAAVPPDAAAAPSATKPGRDFTPEILALYRVVACGHADAPLPQLLTHGDADRTAKLTAVVDAHCKDLASKMSKYRDDYFNKARAWFVAHEPKDLPKTVVYAFGGGDLVSALVAFPDATEITTMSLELAGDPRKLGDLSPEQLAHDLAAFRKDLGLLIENGSNLSTNLSEAQRSAIAAQLSSHLLGMSTGGYEPVSARFFALDDTGAIHYLTADEIDGDTKSGKSLSGAWSRPGFAQSFQNVEVEYRVIGSTDIRTFRHIAWNLGDDYLKKHAEVLRHLDSKGKVAICVKGASYLPWLEDFAMFRKYIAEHAAWMVTDSTGLAPNYAPANLVQEAYGRFEGPPRGYGFERLDGSKPDVAMQALWAKAVDKLPFRFGYVDRNGHAGVILTHPQ